MIIKILVMVAILFIVERAVYWPVLPWVRARITADYRNTAVEERK